MLYLLVLSVDLRDAVGDRLFLSDGFRRDGTLFDVGQATTLKEHAAELSARQAIAQSRKSRGFFDAFKRSAKTEYKPTYNYQPAGTACRVYGTVPVKKVTGQSISQLSSYCRTGAYSLCLYSQSPHYNRWTWLRQFHAC